MAVIDGVLQSRVSKLVAPNIMPSTTNGVISRSQIQGRRARIYIPDYDGRAIGDQVAVNIDTDGRYSFIGSGTVESMEEWMYAVLNDALFANVTKATAYYSIENASGKQQSDEAVYTVKD
jgi:hypothetical protein